MTALQLLEDIGNLEADSDFELLTSLEEFEAQLVQVEPFSELMEKMVCFGSGCASPRFYLARWINKRMKSGVAAEELLNDLKTIITQNRADFAYIQVVVGLELDQTVQINDEVSVSPVSEIEKNFSWLKESLGFNFNGLDKFGRTFLEQNVPTCIILTKFSVDPLLVDSTYEPDSVVSNIREHQADVFRAMILTQSGPIRLAASTSFPINPNVPVFSGGISTPNSIDPILKHSKTDATAMSSLYNQFCSFKERAAMRIAIDRINDARRTNDETSMAIDFGIALEVLLTHGNTGDSDQITYRLGQRAGWLLGQDVDSRDKYATQAKLLYKARSIAVHTGKLTGKASKMFIPPHVDALMIKLIRELLDRSTFPDWDRLTLGDK